MAHSKWSEVEARGFLEALNRSGMSLQQFAIERGIVPQRLRWWKGRLKRAVAPVDREELPALVPVGLKAAPSRGEPVMIDVNYSCRRRQLYLPVSAKVFIT